jgi:hypothetical protein
MSTKKKPYSRIANGAQLRSNEFAHKRLVKKLTAKKAPEWLVRLEAEMNEALARQIKLEDFLYLCDDDKGTNERYSPEALAICGKQRQLLVRQLTAMTKYVAVLAERLDLALVDLDVLGVCKKEAEAKKAPVKKAEAKKAPAEKQNKQKK